jgi:YVTN family beta-propeller protein
MNCSKLFFVALVSSLFLVSCSDDDNQNETPLGSFDNGVLILNQGNFAGGNSSISYLSDDFASFQNGIFSLVNPTLTLGDTGQDIGFYNDLAFVVLNYSNSIQVVNRYTMVSVATIDADLNNPRYIAFANGKGYVTNWGDGGNPSDDFVAVIDLTSYEVLSTIAVAEGPERIVENNNKLYVAHAGGYGYGSTVSVINSSSNTVTATIPVGDVPNSLVFDNGSLYVICGGKPSYAPTETAGKLVKINVSNNTVATQMDFAEATHPSNLVIEDNAIYYTVDADIYKKTISATTLPTEALFSTTAQGVYGVYSFAVNNSKIYVGDAVDYNSNGKVYVYSTLGALENDYTVGVIPAGFYFN